MGSALEEAVREASTPTIEDVTEQINTYLALLEFAWQVEIETLLAQGYSQQNAEQEVLKRGVERTKERWALVPRLRPPCGVHG